MSDFEGFETKKDAEKGKTTQDLIAESQRSVSQANKASIERRQELVQKIAGSAKSPKGKISALSKIDELNKMLLPRYITKLEEAALILASYESELAELDKKLEKMSPNVRAAMGGKAFDKFRKRVNTSLRKLQIHQEATIDRLTG